MEEALSVLIGYVLGSVPVALMVATRHGVDLRTTGDGNPGAWNALDQLGARRAWPAFIGDGLKGLLAGAAGLALGGIEAAYVAVAAAMLGHALPLFARFKGGKAVMTFVGGAFALAPLAALLCLELCAALTAATRRFAYGARAGVFGFPLAQLALDGAQRTAATGALMTLIGVLFLLKRRPSPASAPPPARPRSA